MNNIVLEQISCWYESGASTYTFASDNFYYGIARTPTIKRIVHDLAILYARVSTAGIPSTNTQAKLSSLNNIVFNANPCWIIAVALLSLDRNTHRWIAKPIVSGILGRIRKVA